MEGPLCYILGRFIHVYIVKFVLRFEWAYTRREVCVKFWVSLYPC